MTRNSEFPVCSIFASLIRAHLCLNPNKTDRVVHSQEEDHDPDLYDCGWHHWDLHCPQLSRHSWLDEPTPDFERSQDILDSSRRAVLM